MKKIKIILIIIGIILLFLIIDLVSIFIFHRPLFAIKDDNDSVNIVYRGLLYDTYDCLEYLTPKIKPKGTKYKCSIGLINAGKIIDIVDKTKTIKDFACAEALEGFYEDENYQYYYSCIKGSYMVVKYEDGYEETIMDALKHGTITISDLDNYNIDYIKIEKEQNHLITTTQTNNCDNTKKLYYSDSGINVYTYCLDSIKILDKDTKKELKDYFEEQNTTVFTSMNLIIGNLTEEGMFRDGGTILYKDGGSKKYTNDNISILMCNTIDGNKDIYIGISEMGYENGFCK